MLLEMNGLKIKVNNVMHPDCPKCSQKMKLVIYGEVLREPNQSDDWVHSNGIKGNKKGDEYVCLECNTATFNVEGYDPTL